MPSSQVKKYQFLYKRTKGNAGKLPWAHKEPTKFLSDIVQKREPGRALDVGCGSGVDSVYLARNGWDVTSLDLVEEPLRMTEERAKREGVKLTIRQADITEWPNTEQFDLIVDAGVLHNLPKAFRADHCKRIKSWLKSDGNFVLVHHFKRHSMDWAPIGPRRVAREDIDNLFAPEFSEKGYETVIFKDLPLIVGKSLAQSYYWFQHS